MKIDLPVPFNEEEVNLLNMHSVLNVLNVVQFQLLMTADKLGSPDSFNALIEKTAALGARLADKDSALKLLQSVDDYIHEVREVYAQTAREMNLQGDTAFQASLHNVESIFAVLRVRAEEILHRSDNPDQWTKHSAKVLKRNFNQVFQAIERNSHGAYHIVNNIAAHHDGDYLVQLEFTPKTGDEIRMPAVFQDVMRDLLANARKYTEPGGRIDAGLYQNDTSLRFVVQDTGRGIPEAEIAEVVSFGKRGSNVKDRPTRSGGFGLSKAYYVTKMHNGDMWIDSSTTAPTGTRIEIELPCPA